ncbi:transcriptional regulator, partial [Enterococcus faecalis]|nr:transcriptional regulator [Enterococcus faecalis]
MKEHSSTQSTYTERLLKKVLDNSEANNWDSAVLEWDITAWDEDDEQETSCLCGKENLKYLFTITNRENGNELEPIGSQCIKKFEREDLNEETAIFEKLFKLKTALSENNYIGLSSDFFSRKLLDFFY